MRVCILALMLVATMAFPASGVTMGCGLSPGVANRNPSSITIALPPQIGRLYLPLEYWAWMVEAGAEFGVDPHLIAAFAAIESRFDPEATSGQGACIGLMQLQRDTAASLGVDPWNPRENIRGGAQILSKLMRRYGGNLKLVCRKYNATCSSAYTREILNAHQQARRSQ